LPASTPVAIRSLGVVGTSAHFASGVLSVRGPSGSVATLHFTGSYSTGFTVGSDHHGGTLIRLG
jgi:hypothetical protein